jgi:carbamoyltransferase
VLILGIHDGGHDSAASLFDDYRLVAAIQSERMTRQKGQGGYPRAAIAAVLRAGGATAQDVDTVVLSRTNIRRAYMRFPGLWTLVDWYKRFLRGREYVNITRMLHEMRLADVQAVFRRERFLAGEGFRPDATVAFHNHHLAHALSALFFTDWDHALLYTADAGGDNVQYSARILKDGALTCLFGGEGDFLKPHTPDSVALAYAYATEACGFRSFRHEGKLTGLAAFGRPVLAERMKRLFTVGDDGRIHGNFKNHKGLRTQIFQMARGQGRADVAASVQEMLEDVVLAAVQRILATHPAPCLGLAGGIFANVRLNARLKACAGVREIFICPAMGDEGQVVGGPLCYLLERDGLAAWLAHRQRLQHVYWGGGEDGGEDADDAGIDATLAAHPAVRRHPGPPVAEAVARLQAGQAGAIFAGRMEFGPRALGARSILASPADRGVNDRLNARLQRTEFMPFAPYVAEEDAARVFEVDAANAYACRFMTITTPVRAEWKERIPAVVHVDGTARPQIVRREENPLYHDILQAFKEATGLPVLVNTSFNTHEEPIIHTARECLAALVGGRVDFVVTPQALYFPDSVAGKGG